MWSSLSFVSNVTDRHRCRAPSILERSYISCAIRSGCSMACKEIQGSSLNQASLTRFFPRKYFQQPELEVRVATADVEDTIARKRAKLLDSVQKDFLLVDGDNINQDVGSARCHAAGPVLARLPASTGGACSGGGNSDEYNRQERGHTVGCTVKNEGKASGSQDCKAVCSSDSEDSLSSDSGSQESAGRLQAYELKVRREVAHVL